MTIEAQAVGALLLAQAVVDAYDKWDGSADREDLDDAIENLRAGLARIGKGADAG